MKKFLQLVLFISFLALSAAAQDSVHDQSQKESENKETVLFDGKSLAAWKVTNFGGEGECRVEDGAIVVDAGYPLSGITCTTDGLPKTNYELSVEAMKTEGDDFFCGLTFPVGDSFCTFIAGGWGGNVSGLSCIDGKDADNNATKKLKSFKSNQWYLVRVRVRPGIIKVWVGEQLMVNENIKDKKLSLRKEVEKSKPLGLSNFQTASKFRNIRILKLD